jgi:hypothetical protein
MTELKNIKEKVPGSIEDNIDIEAHHNFCNR